HRYLHSFPTRRSSDLSPLEEFPPFTIVTDDQLQGTYKALGLLYETLASMRRRILPIKPRNYAIFAEGHIDEILKLQSEIDTYLGDRKSTRLNSSHQII